MEWKKHTNPDFIVRLNDDGTETAFSKNCPQWSDFESWISDGNTPAPVFTKEEEQERVNIEARLFLSEKGTGWKVIRHRDQLAMGIPTSLSEQEFQDLLAERQKKRDQITE